DAERLGALERLLAREHRWGVDGDGSKAGSPQRSVEALKAQVQLAAGAATPDEDWWASLRPGLGGRNCATASDDCILLTPDLDGDGTADPLLCTLDSGSGAHCVLHARRPDGRWSTAATVDLWPQDADPRAWQRTLRRDLLDGRIEAVPRRWPDLRLG